MTRLRLQLAFVRIVLILSMIGDVCVHSFGMFSSAIRSAAGHRNSQLSVTKNRREFIQEHSVGMAAGFLGILVTTPSPAHATYGASSSMELPNYIEFLIEKNTVADPSTFLYQGPDPQIQLNRLLEASRRLGDIPDLAKAKKWSQVQGILTGPLGTLGQTLTSISKAASSQPIVAAKAKQVKENIYQISLAASKKMETEVLASTQAAAASLEEFVRLAF